MPPYKVLLVANSSWYLFNFRLPLIRDLRDRGYKVSLVAPHDAHTPLLQAEGFTVHPWKVSRSSVNPLSEARAFRSHAHTGVNVPILFTISRLRPVYMEQLLPRGHASSGNKCSYRLGHIFWEPAKESFTCKQ